MTKTVYVETSVPSFFYEARSEPEMVARREWTRQWWATAGERYDLVTSAAVIDELERGEYPSRDDYLKLIAHMEILEITPAVVDVVETYISRRVMPADPVGDALHLALASIHQCDFLVTWNCRHLANANKFGHIRRVNTLLGLYVPSLVTPLELLEDDGNED
jgi:predicted nucleic acid-binding protein